jgi:hypothetical protein
LKGEFDEWLARIICYALNLSPETLVKQTNRATAETGKEQALEQGLEPRKLFVKDLIDDALERIGADDLQLQWQDEEIVDAETRATVVVSLRGGTTGSALPIIGLQEARRMLRLKPADGELLTELEDAAEPPTPAPLSPGADQSTEPGKGGKKPATPPEDRAAKRRGRGALPPGSAKSQAR